MASTYSTNLALELMATGEKANTWGDITNTNLGTLLEQSISGYVTQAITDGSGATTTITIPNGATGVARNMFIEMTGALTFSTTSLVVPANKKLYFIYNNTTGGFAVTVKVTGLTGVSVPNGQKMVLVSNGTDVVVATNYMATLAVGSLTSGRVPYATTAGLLTDSANLTFNGTKLTVAGLIDSALTSGRVTYATTSGELTDSANLTFNGTTLTANTIGAFTLGGTVAGGGNQLNNVIIGTSTPLAGNFTTVSATTSVTTPSVTNAGTLALSATSTNIITASTNGSERARIDTVGNVLIGGTAARGTTAGAAHLDLFNGTAPAGTLTNGISLYSSSGDFNFMDSSGNGYKVGFRNVPAVGTKTASYTLATTDIGKYVQVGTSGAIVIPDATFAEGDIVSIFNNTSGNITITCSITTAYISGTDSDKATMTLATRGIATVFFISGTVCVVSGSVT